MTFGLYDTFANVMISDKHCIHVSQMGNGGTGAFNNCAGQGWSMFPGPFEEDIWGAQYGGCSYREVAMVQQDYNNEFSWFCPKKLYRAVQKKCGLFENSWPQRGQAK